MTNLAWILVAAAACGGDQAKNTMEAVVASGDTEIRVEAGDDTLRIHSLKTLPAGSNWIPGAATAARVPLIASIEMGGRTLPLHWRIVGGTRIPGSRRRPSASSAANRHWSSDRSGGPIPARDRSNIRS